MHLSIARPLVSKVGYVTQWFGENPQAYTKFALAGHNGIDYGVVVGTPVLSPIDGTVTHITDQGKQGYGLNIIIECSGCSIILAHLSEVQVVEGDTVVREQQVALSGNTGNSTGPHLHLGIRVPGMRNQAYNDYVDPAPFRDI
jgi:murein DD-endopeptidase MepM/ murein hydrolase activator NlpD